MKYVILDVDTGIDDALAIAYAVQSPELRLLGITTCYGNVSVEEATRNTLQVLDILEAEEIPVVPGADKPFAREHVNEAGRRIHGQNGLGNTSLPSPRRTARSQQAAEFIVSTVREYPNRVTLITVGSQTNLALAIQKDPAIVDLVERVVIMGGAVTVPGNVTPYAEANIYADPEAASLVFQSGIPITLVGLDVTMQTLLTRTHVQDWRALNTPFSRFLADICDYYIDAYHQFDPSLGGCALHDPLAVGVVIDPSFVKCVPMHVRVDLEGEVSKGRTVQVHQAEPNMEVCLEVDVERFVSHFLQRVCKSDCKADQVAVR
ncbi:nucleoside hydrolase [Effusibacillus pohliae]|uniref:nucleoside hydrolase n=1 Tax=Effusibacillus pohliae TaxID=232270 RepID=UPI0003764842|nr:nucleoside hydrolase [Effusibacillus pohliae]